MSEEIMSFLTFGAVSARAATEKSILACGAFTEKHGIVIDERCAAALAEAKTKALGVSERVEFGESAVAVIIEAFADSPYLSNENFTETMSVVIGVFYEAKNAVADRVSDRALAEFLRRAFDGVCGGDADSLGGTVEGLVRHINGGGAVCDFDGDIRESDCEEESEV